MGVMVAYAIMTKMKVIIAHRIELVMMQDRQMGKK
jgi:hypothetical protein